MKNQELKDEISKLKKEMNAVILVHNYQRPEIYDIADYIGDSYDLSVQASKTNADIIVFCGVRFMAETAYILNSEKKVLLPAKESGCPMADTVTAQDLIDLRKQYPDAAIVSYMNTTAEVKAESDVICTSSNAIKIVNSLPHKRVVFVPDRNLAIYVAEHTAKEVIPWNGFCYVHDKLSHEELAKVKQVMGNAKVIAHPECRKEFRDLADHVCSTSGMVTYAKRSESQEFIIGTESGMLEMLKRELPDKKFYPVPSGGTCAGMKRNTIEKVLQALTSEAPVVTVPGDIRVKAKKALDRMIQVTK
ncbi:MAG: quinolinate synthase NadA [Deltaproteobacteria bacterium]|nr:quinolinate synthase NadA [Deltaproteobacteria bacterium]